MSKPLSTVADRRTTNLRFRQHQFLSLRKWIDGHIPDFEAALKADEGMSKAEARSIIAMGLDDLRRNYDSLDLKAELDVEFRLRNGQENSERTVAEELVYVIPDRYTLFYSVMSSLCACIAAGSCCIVELPTDLTRTSSILRRMVCESLDELSFGVATIRPHSNRLRKCMVIDQQNETSPENARRLLRSDKVAGTVAIVDRTANVDLAAKNIAMSMTLYSGRGPYAPTCILVNEYVWPNFSLELEKHVAAATEQQSSDRSMNGNAYSHQTTHGSTLKAQTAPGQETHINTTDRSEVQIERLEKNGQPFFVQVSSLDDIIDLIHSRTSRSLLAAYIFADPSPAKYLGQFIKADANFVGHIPGNLLVGPAAPAGYPISPTSRFRREMVVSPSPQFVHLTSEATSVIDVMKSPLRISEDLLKAAFQPLNPTGQAKEGEMNFFALGLRVGMGVYVLPVALTMVGGLAWGSRRLYQHWY